MKYLGDFTYEYHYWYPDNQHFHDSSSFEGPVPVDPPFLSPSQSHHPTYNILLEYGDMDLEDYFTSCVPPVLPSEILAFWRDLVDVPESVSKLHDRHVERHGRITEYHV